MKHYITHCLECDWTGEEWHKPGARDMGREHEEDNPGHVTDVEVFRDG